ncbi:hypothetical protein BD414DRAFT_502547 [Trametes punicea]|nr:hypothetical protein BD414DRAFT_502547 [Trametes punicea]
MVAGFGSTLKVAEGGPRIVGDELRIDTRSGTGCTHVDGFGHVGRDGALLRLRGYLENDGDSDVDELLQFGVVDLGRSDGRISGVGVGAGEELLGAVDESKNIFAPGDSASGIGVWLLDGDLLDGEDGHGRQRSGERRGTVARDRGRGRGSAWGRGAGIEGEVGERRGEGRPMLVGWRKRRGKWLGERGGCGGGRGRRPRGPVGALERRERTGTARERRSFGRGEA